VVCHSHLPPHPWTRRLLLCFGLGQHHAVIVCGVGRHISFCGDLDIVGHRKPQSRESTKPEAVRQSVAHAGLVVCAAPLTRAYIFFKKSIACSVPDGDVERVPAGDRRARARPGGAARGGGLVGLVSRRAVPSWNRSMLTEIYLCHACSDHEIEDGNARAGPPSTTPGPGTPRRAPSSRSTSTAVTQR
jgi:hypothetical protein